jgi:hypothetical protein
VAELPLDMAFVQFGGRGEAWAQGMSREFVLPVGFGKIATHARVKRRALNQAGDMLVFEAVRADMLSAGWPNLIAPSRMSAAIVEIAVR